MTRSRPALLFAFRIQNVPLPRGETLAPRRLSGLEQESPFNGGGLRGPSATVTALLSPVTVAGRPAANGNLWLALTPLATADGQRVTWYQAAVKGQGAEFAAVTPGRYRAFRIYDPGAGSSIPVAGQWLGSEVTVEIPPGGQMRLPPLEWKPDRSAPAAKKPVPRAGRS